MPFLLSKDTTERSRGFTPGNLVKRPGSSFLIRVAVDTRVDHGTMGRVDVSQSKEIDQRNRDNAAEPSLSLTPLIAVLIELMRNSTITAVAVCCGESIPNPPCAIGNTAK
eukprot:5741321-Ditylum_brightwellii.AAC.1